MGIWHYYYDKSRCYFSINTLMTASRITIAALLLSFGALAIIPTINTVSALENDIPLANNTNSVANNHSIGKQIAGSQSYSKSNPNMNNNNDTTTNSDHSLREYSIILPFPIPIDENKKTQTSHDGSTNNDDKSNASPHKNNNNDNKDSKLKDTTKKTPLLLPFP